VSISMEEKLEPEHPVSSYSLPSSFRSPHIISVQHIYYLRFIVEHEYGNVLSYNTIFE
jgi:hypothetical protein